MSKEILDKFELINRQNNDEIIDYYESNKLYFNNFQNFSQPDTILDIINIKLSYCFALINKYHHSKCLEPLEHLDILINRIKDENVSEYNTIYEQYLFAEGIVLGYLKKYEESQSNFKKLIKIDPDHTLYKKWYENNKMRIIAKQTNIIGWSGFAIVMIEMICDVLFKINLGKHVSLIGFAIMLIGFSLPYILKQINKLKLG